VRSKYGTPELRCNHVERAERCGRVSLLSLQLIGPGRRRSQDPLDATVLGPSSWSFEYVSVFENANLCEMIRVDLRIRRITHHFRNLVPHVVRVDRFEFPDPRERTFLRLLGSSFAADDMMAMESRMEMRSSAGWLCSPIIFVQAVSQ